MFYTMQLTEQNKENFSWIGQVLNTI